MISFQELERFTAARASGESGQGIATDGSFLYETDGATLRKYSMAGSLQTSRTISGDGSVSHAGDLCVTGGFVYVAMNNYNTSPKLGYINKYDASDLSYEGEFQVANNWTAGLDFDGTDFWVCYDDTDNIEKRDTSFNLLDTVTPDYVLDGSHKWQGIAIKDGNYYLNPHDGSTPDCVVEFDDNWQFVRNIMRPIYCTQGLGWNGDNLYLLARDSSDYVIRTTPEAEDYRNRKVSIVVDQTERWTTSGSYIEQAHLKNSLTVKKNDIVRVVLQGLFRVSGGSARAYADVASGSPASASLIVNTPTIRWANTNAEGIMYQQESYFRVTSDGKLDIAMKWKMQNAGTGYADDRTISVQVVGRDTDTF